jgi:hypothetical protein
MGQTTDFNNLYSATAYSASYSVQPHHCCAPSACTSATSLASSSRVNRPLV